MFLAEHSENSSTRYSFLIFKKSVISNATKSKSLFLVNSLISLKVNVDFPIPSDSRRVRRGGNLAGCAAAKGVVMKFNEKYRPKTLSEVVGQPIGPLEEFARDPYPTCIALEGPTGTGKTSAAIALAADLGAYDDPLLGAFGPEITNGARLGIDVPTKIELFSSSGIGLSPDAERLQRIIQIEYHTINTRQGKVVPNKNH